MPTSWLSTSLAVLKSRRMLTILLLGFASGLPLALTGQAMQSWLTADGVDIKTIGLLALVGLPYTYKFLWAPLMDRFEPPLLGRRKGWLLITQVALAALLLFMAGVTPAGHIGLFALCAVGVAFFSASQDVVVDAYKVDVSNDDDRGLIAALGVTGYRIAMLTSGGLAFLLAEVIGWGPTCAWLGALMAAIAVLTQLLAPRLPYLPDHHSGEFLRFALSLLLILGAAAAALWLVVPRLGQGWGVLAALSAAIATTWLVAAQLFAHWRALAGFIAMLAGAWLGYVIAQQGLLLLGLLAGWPDFTPDSKNNWIGLLFVLLELALAVPFAMKAAKLARFELLLTPMQQYFRREYAWAFLLLIILYKLCDAFAGVLSVTFLQKGIGFSMAEIGVVNKVVGMVATIVGGIFGGLLMLRWRLYKSLLVFGILQIVSNLGFWLLAIHGQDALGSLQLPLSPEALRVFMNGKSLTAWDGGVDILLALAMTIDNFAGGMGTAALVALLMALCRREASATHYALLSALAAVGRIYVGPSSGYLVAEIGWQHFFEVSMLMGLPGMLLLWRMKAQVGKLDHPNT
ncbi:AmpG family muropeptide MFS transporter [Chitinilyticum litopenaei]|uniref:AmpG family muropeptide MFS transporter n=1 Tax=Chitinilyticum litopenaei TaxID=1121276 RepID=UPI0004176237|nr:MFS transporter [Chitinilyticum litopenaei]